MKKIVKKEKASKRQFKVGDVVICNLTNEHPKDGWEYGKVVNIITEKPVLKNGGELAYGVPWDNKYPLIEVDVNGRTLWADGKEIKAELIKLHPDKSVINPVKLIEELASIESSDDEGNTYYILEQFDHLIPTLKPFLGMMVRRSINRNIWEGDIVIKYAPTKKEVEDGFSHAPSFTITFNEDRLSIDMNTRMAMMVNGT